MNTPTKHAIYEQIARVARALASGRRLELLEQLGQGPRTVEALGQAAGMGIASTSQHLQILRAAGLVDATREGLFVTYRLSGTDVANLHLLLRQVAEEHVAEVARIARALVSEGDGGDPIDRRELFERVRRGEVILLDVRPAEEYAAGHLAGAVSIPLPDLARLLGKLPRRKEVVAYCRGPYCLLSVEAVRLLRQQGLRARRLEDGVQEWRARGLPLALPTSVTIEKPLRSKRKGARP